MSYCRWSSNDFQCDLYIIGDADGITTYVASTRYVISQPLPPVLEWPGPEATKEEVQAWAEKEVERYEKVMAILHKEDRQPIGLRHDGKAFHDPDGVTAAKRVRELKEMGYRVPDGVAEALEEENWKGTTTKEK